MKKMKIIKTLTSVAVLAIASNSAWAGGTASNTPVNNTATINYTLGATAQTPIASSPTGNTTPGTVGTPTTFLVDKKVDLLVTPPGSSTTVFPNSDGAGTTNDLTFVVTNEGNDPQNFSFSVSDIAGGNFDPNTCTATPSTATALAADATINVIVSCEIPDLGTAPNGGVAAAGTVANAGTTNVGLLATVTGVTATLGADDPGVVDTVFADGTGTSQDTADRNAEHAAEGTYIVSSANLEVQKTEAISAMNIDLNSDGDFLDPGETNATGYHVPGSTVTYTITVSNAPGAATAAGIVITDAVPGTMTLVGTPVLSGNASGSATSGTANAVVTPSFSLAAGQAATLTIIATIN